MLARAFDAKHPAGVDGATGARRTNLHLAAQILSRHRPGRPYDVGYRADADDLAAVLTGAWTKIDDVIRRAHRLLIVLDDDHGVTKVAELLECRDQTRIIALMKTD